MIQVTIYRRADGSYAGYELEGHAGYAESGQDIICAGVSILSENTANAIEALTGDAVSGEMDEERGYLKVVFPEIPGDGTRLLMDAMVLGLDRLMQLGSGYIKILNKEV